MDDDQLIDLTRRALEAGTRQGDRPGAPQQHTVDAREYTSLERHDRDRAMLMASPQLVGYVSELPRPGAYCTKTVMGRSILLTRTSEGSVKAFDNVCLHRQSQVATGCGIAKRFTCPYHAWTYDNTGRLVALPGREGFPEMTLKSDGLTELPAAEFAGFLWVALDPGATLDVAAHLGPLADELDSWGIGRWSPLGEKVLDSPINWKLAVDTFAENYHFATVHRQTFATIARSNCTVFDAYGPHHRLIFPLNDDSGTGQRSRRPVGPVPQHGRDLRAVPQHRAVGDNRQRRAVPDLPRRPIRAGPSPFTRTRHRWTCPTNPWPPALRPSSSMRMPPCATRTTGWSQALQANLESGARDTTAVRAQRTRDCSIATSPGSRRLPGAPSAVVAARDSTAIRSSRTVASVSFWPGCTFVNSSTASPRRPAATNGTT